jgi:hypothetical protein
MNRLQLHYQTASKPDNTNNNNDSNSSNKKQKNDEDNSNSSKINDNINDLSHYIDPKTRHIKQLSKLKKKEVIKICEKFGLNTVGDLLTLRKQLSIITDLNVCEYPKDSEETFI